MNRRFNEMNLNLEAPHEDVGGRFAPPHGDVVEVGEPITDEAIQSTRQEL